MVKDDNLFVGDLFSTDHHRHHKQKLLLLPEPPPENRTQINENEWSLVVIRDSPDSLLNNNNINHYYNGGVSIFPPSNHENLHLLENGAVSSKVPCFSHDAKEIDRDPDPTPDPPLIKADPPLESFSKSAPSSNWWWVGMNPGWLGVWFQILRVKIWGLSLRSPLYGWWWNKSRDFIGAFWLFLSPRVVGLTIAALLWWLRRRFLRRRVSKLDRVMMSIKERDEKIIQLLSQIVQTNEALLAHQKIS